MPGMQAKITSSLSSFARWSIGSRRNSFVNRTHSSTFSGDTKSRATLIHDCITQTNCYEKIHNRQFPLSTNQNKKVAIRALNAPSDCALDVDNLQEWPQLHHSFARMSMLPLLHICNRCTSSWLFHNIKEMSFVWINYAQPREPTIIYPSTITIKVMSFTMGTCFLSPKNTEKASLGNPEGCHNPLFVPMKTTATLTQLTCWGNFQEEGFQGGQKQQDFLSAQAIIPKEHHDTTLNNPAYLRYSSFSFLLCSSSRKKVWSWTGWKTWEKIQGQTLSRNCAKESRRITNSQENIEGETYFLKRRIHQVLKLLWVFPQVILQLWYILTSEDIP